MAKFLMGLSIIVLLVTNVMTGYCLYELASENNLLKATAVKASSTSPTTTQIQLDSNKPISTAAVVPAKDKIASQNEPQSQVKSNEVNKEKTVNFYYIDDNKIKEAIGKGKICVMNCDIEFKLPKILTSKDDRTVFFPTEAKINTPYAEVLSYSGFEYYKNDVEVAFDKAKGILDFNELNFSVQFNGKIASNNFVVYIEQEKRIDAISSSNSTINSDNSLKSISFPVNAIDFNKKATLIVQHKEEKSIYKYDVDFSKYLR